MDYFKRLFKDTPTPVLGPTDMLAVCNAKLRFAESLNTANDSSYYQQRAHIAAQIDTIAALQEQVEQLKVELRLARVINNPTI